MAVPLLKWILGYMRRRSRFVAVFGAMTFILSLHFILKYEGSSSENAFQNIHLDIPDDFSPKRVTEREIFPSGGDLKIPKIIHQTWKDTNIPAEFSSWIQTWLALHPDWEYWLWTDESADQLILERYPEFTDMFRGYTQPIRRADALRYIVLYEYGGLYADMDMEALTSLEPLSMKYSCFIGQEPYEHPALDTNFEKLLINALMGCKKGHPFMKMLVDNLPKYAMFWDFLDSTGPHFVTHLYRQYITEHDQQIGDDDFVYVTPSEYFYPSVDPVKVPMFVEKCNNAKYLSELQIEACRNLKFKSLPKNRFDAKQIAFTNHHWYHTYLRNILEVLKSYQSIQDIVPKVKIFTVQ